MEMSYLSVVAACVVACSIAGCMSPPEGGADDELRGPKRAATQRDDAADESTEDRADATDESASPDGASEDTLTPEPAAPPAGSTGGNTADRPVPDPSTITLKLDGTTLAVEGFGVGPENLFIKVSGPGIAAGTDFSLSATRLGSGCESGVAWITYRPRDGDKQYMPKAGPSCGLTIGGRPLAIGDRFKGSFNGTLHAINTTTPRSKKVEITFDVVRTK
jgi:hypothetical protein